MARLNIEDQFFMDAGAIAHLVGSYHVAIGQAMHFLRFAQDRFKNNMIVSDNDWTREGFHDALVPKFATKVEGGYRAYDDDAMFGWLIKRVEAGAKGGTNAAKARRSKSNDLVVAKPSKPQQTIPSPSFSPSSTVVNKEVNTPHGVPDKLHWLGDLWNHGCGSLPKVKTTTSRLKVIARRLKENDSQAYWMQVVAKINQSDFCNGKVPGRTWEADFDWLIGTGKTGVPNHQKVMEDKYINKAQRGVKGTGTNAGLYEQLEASYDEP